MALLDCPFIQTLKTREVNHFMDADEITIPEAADMNSTPGGGGNVRQNPKNISSTLGHMIAWKENAASPEPTVSRESDEELLAMYLYLAQAPYRGWTVEYRFHTFGPDNYIDRQCGADLYRMGRGSSYAAGGQAEPGGVMELVIDHCAVGLYVPEWRCFMPGAGFHDLMSADMSGEPEPYVIHRCRAILTGLLEYGAKSEVIGRLLERIGGRLSEREMSVYRGEERLLLSREAEEAVRAHYPGENPMTVCGCLGTNSPGKMLAAPVLIDTGTEPVSDVNYSFRCFGRRLVMIPPVQDTERITDVSYEWGPEDENGIPAWIDFRGVLDGVLYRKIYASGFRICRPRHIIDLAYQAPAGLLKKYHYLVQDSAAGALGLEETDTVWKAYPEDPSDMLIRLRSLQYQGEGWEIHQRGLRIERLELREAVTGAVLGTVIPRKIPEIQRDSRRVCLSLDPAGAVSVRLVAAAGSSRAEGLAYEQMIYPITPVSAAEFDQTVERRTVPPKRKGATHFDSLLQVFFTENPGSGAGLMTENRIWQPDENDLFDALKSHPGLIGEAMNELGVINNMKEQLTRPGISARERQRMLLALKQYIGIMILEAVLSLAKKGFSIQNGNLEFLISYPENGSGEGITRMMQDAIRGALGFVNEYLTEANQLQIGNGVTLCSESEATGVWHQVNPPDGHFMGPSVAVGTPDYGYSTHDFSLRADGMRMYMFSLPYAAQRITNGTLAKVYDGNAAGLVRCFSGGSQELKEQARQALEKAMETQGGQLYERLGFTLSLNRLFSHCGPFRVTGVNADRYQMKFQELTEARLNVAIPAYADAIARALHDGALRPDRDVLLAPVGKGSLAMENTAPGFEDRFSARLCAELNYLLREDRRFSGSMEYTGRIRLLPNNDTDKRSVAEGMLAIRERAGGRDEKGEIIPVGDTADHYLDLVYGGGETDEKDRYRRELEALSGPSKKLACKTKKEALYHDAFQRLFDGYTYEQFEEAFERFGYTGIEEGIEEPGVLDEAIRCLVRDQFENMCAQLREQGEGLIMACPFVEKEMLCGGLIDLAISRMELFPEEK